MNRVDRYLIKEIAVVFLATVAVLLAMVLVNRFADLLGRAATGDLSRGSILLLMGFQAVRFAAKLVPPALLLAIMLALGRLYRDNEMTALGACGFGQGAVYRPLFMIAVPMALLLGVLTLKVVPDAMHLQYELQAKAQQEAQASLVTPGQFREVSGVVIYAGGSGAGGGVLERVFVQSAEGGRFAVVTGRSGYQEVVPETGTRYLVLEDGRRYEGRPGEGDFRNVTFERMALKVGLPETEDLRVRREAYPLAEIWGSERKADVAELHERLGGPLSVLVIAFIAPLIARTKPREGRYSRVVAAVLVYIIYMNLLGVGEAWLKYGRVPAWAGMWWVHLTIGGAGLVLWHLQYGLWGARASRRGRAP